MKGLWLAVNCLLGVSVFGATSITQYGITWTFDRDCQTGQYASGDYWVIGPVSIVAMTNNYHTSGFLPAAGQDGCMINPGTDTKQGYDDRLGSYQASLNRSRPNGAPVSPGNPLVLNVNESLVSQVSWLYTISGAVTNTEPGCPAFNSGTGTPRPITRAAAILTCVSNAPPAGSFRPPYCGTDKTPKFNVSQLDSSKLADLAPVANTPVLADLEAAFSRPWIDHVNEYLGAFVHPTLNMPEYGQDVSIKIGDGALMLQLDFSQLAGSPSKTKLLTGFTQVGIDLAGIADNGGFWPSNGGHQMGRKFPILCAGTVLNDSHMKAVGSWSTDFQEDLDTFVVSQAEVNMTHSAAWNPDSRSIPLAYETANIGLPEWGIRHVVMPEADNMHWDTKYRQINYSGYTGWVLAAQIMGLRGAWNHEVLFDYIDRSTSIVNPYYSGEYQIANNVYGGQFAYAMWNAYRADYLPRWIPDNPSNLYGQGQRYYGLSITTASPLPTGQAGQFYSQTLTAAIGTPPYTWAIASGALPSGLILVSSGSITGTPVSAVSSSFDVKVTDSIGRSVTNAFALTIFPAATMLNAIDITGDGADWTVGLNTSGMPTKISNGAAATVNVCDDNPAYNQLDECAVLVFQLPAIPAGETVMGANLAVTWEADNMQSAGTGHPGSADTAMPKWVDLYAVRTAASNTVLTSDYGYKTVRAAGDVLIQQQFLYQAASVTMDPVLQETDDTADATLGTWLKAQYTAGAQAGNYIFLRIQGMQDSGNAWKINSGNAASGQPILTVFTGATGGGTSGDADSDSIPDNWETQYFGGATNANPNALAANGINTIYETYVAGLNPTNAQSVFSVSNSWNTLHWVAVSGRVYSVWGSTNLLGNFQPLETNILWPQNSWTGQAGGAEAFYKLSVQLDQP